VVRAGWRQMFSALGHREFRVLWLGMLPSMFALQMGSVVIGFVAYDISGIAAVLGIIAAGMGIPMFSLSLIGGVVADRVRKRNVILFSQLSIGIAVTVIGILILTDLIEIWHLVVMALVQGTAFAFNMPARQAYIAEVVPREALMNAVALNNAGMSMSRIAGPAAAGLLISIPVIGSGGVFLFMGAMYVIAITALFWVPPGTAHPSKHSGIHQLKDGLRYVKNHPVLRILLLLALAPIVLGMPYVQIMPVFAEDVFDVGASGLGMLMALNGVGALIGSLIIASAGNVQRRGLLQLGLGVTFGVSLAIFAFSPSYILALIAIMVVGGAGSGYMTLNNTLLIMNAGPEYHGRVMSLGMMSFSMMPLGSVPVSWIVDQVGAPLTIGVAGIGLTVVVTIVAIFSKNYREI
jgi:MFS family permease